jgi:plastocyanin
MDLLVRSSVRLSYLVIFIFSGNLTAGELLVTIEDKKQRSVHDTVVELVGIDTKAGTVIDVEITQLDKEFSPELSVIPRGSSVLFTNNDPFQHHVYSVSKGNQFDLPLYKDIPAKQINFDTPGIVKLGCNIHDWMLAFSYVSQSQYISITDSTGKVKFTDLPEGEYQLHIWNPRLKKNKKVITQPLSIEQEQPLEHKVTVSLRKKIRKPRRIEGSSPYKYD